MRRHGFSATLRQMARDAARAERARQQQQARQEAARIRAIRYAEQRAKADAREAARMHVAAQVEETEELNRGVQDQETAINGLLARALTRNPGISLQSTLRSFQPARFDESRWPSEGPRREDYALVQPGFFARMMPGSSGRHEKRVQAANARFEADDSAHQERRRARAVQFREFEAQEGARRAEVDRYNAEMRAKRQALEEGEHEAVVAYYKEVIGRGLEGEPDAISAEVGYSPGSRHLVVDLELPEITVVPEEAGFKYVKSADRIDPVARPAAKRRTLYGHLLCQIALKCIDTVFRGGPGEVVDCLTLNGMLDTIDPATGQQVRVCLISVRVTWDAFHALNLAQVQPEQCLRSLKASVSRSPAELVAVKPLVELDMVDPRFVDAADVLSGLDKRQNLMELSPNEFENLITNLFATMGLDTRQTQASRDGGVDCVAFDQRPVFGGKVVIQAKRYKNTVGVSAVRDLFGTVQNEGASKGILVTTSGYGKAAYDFAKGKPLELLDGGNLLHLLAEHAGVDARIVAPEGWADLPVHGE